MPYLVILLAFCRFYALKEHCQFVCNLMHNTPYFQGFNERFLKALGWLMRPAAVPNHPSSDRLGNTRTIRLQKLILKSCIDMPNFAFAL